MQWIIQLMISIHLKLLINIEIKSLFYLLHTEEKYWSTNENAFKAVKRLIEDYDDLALVYPVHMNPKVRELAETYLGNHERIELIEPLDVVDFHNFANMHILL